MKLQLPHWLIIVCVGLMAAGKAVESSLPAPWASVDAGLLYALMFVTGGLGLKSGSAFAAGDKK
jgi:hypothetical protein